MRPRDRDGDRMLLALVALLGTFAAFLLYRAGHAWSECVELRASRAAGGRWLCGSAVAPPDAPRAWFSDACFAWFHRVIAVEPTHHEGARSPWQRHETTLVEASARELVIRTADGKVLRLRCAHDFEAHDACVRHQAASTRHGLAPPAAAALEERHPELVLRAYERLRAVEEWIPDGTAICVRLDRRGENDRIDRAYRGSIERLARRRLLGAGAFGTFGLVGLTATVWVLRSLLG